MIFLNKIIKNFLSKDSKEEVDSLQSWHSDTKEQINFLKNIHSDVDIPKEIADYRDFKPEEAWINFESKLPQQKETPNIVRMISKSAIAIAASFIIILSVWPLFEKSSDNTQVFQEYTTVESHKILSLADGSIVTLDKNSQFFQNGIRSSKLSGRAFFEVKSDPKNPFEIEMNKGKVKVLGTKFEVTSLEDFTEVWVTEGKVELSLGTDSIILTKGESGIIQNDKIIKKVVEKNFDLTWVKNELVFDDEEIMSVLEKVAKHYKKNLVFNTPLIEKECKIRTKFQNATLSEVMEELNLLTGIKYEIKKDKLSILEINC